MSLALGILVAEPAMLTRALDLVASAPDADAQLFLMHEGVRVAGDERLRAAIDDGLDAWLCAMDAEARGLSATRGGPRFGSQMDHAAMVRDARRVVAMTGGRIDDNDAALLQALATPPGVARPRRVALRLVRPPGDPKIAQALRSAVAYAAAGLEVVVVVEPPARDLLMHDEHAAPVVRALATLRALGHRLVEVADAATRVSCDVEVSW